MRAAPMNMNRVCISPDQVRCGSTSGVDLGSASVTAMKNSHGVLIEMVATHLGLNLSLAKGVTIALEK